MYLSLAFKLKDRCSVFASRHTEFTSTIMELYRHYELELVRVPILLMSLDHRCIYMYINKWCLRLVAYFPPSVLTLMNLCLTCGAFQENFEEKWVMDFLCHRRFGTKGSLLASTHCRICPQIAFLSPFMSVEDSKVGDYTGKHFCVHCSCN